MDETQKKRTLDQWDYEADAGLVTEPPDEDEKHQTGIICTRLVSENGSVCGAPLRDLPFFVQEIIRARRAVGCEKCSNLQSRKIAKVKNG